MLLLLYNKRREPIIGNQLSYLMRSLSNIKSFKTAKSILGQVEIGSNVKHLDYSHDNNACTIVLLLLLAVLIISLLLL